MWRSSVPRAYPWQIFFRVGLELIDRTSFFTKFQAVGDTWIHMVINYIGPQDGKGIWIYYNGLKVAGDITTKSSPSHMDYGPSDGVVYVGKFRNRYSSVAIDVLLFFNNKLTDAQIWELYDQGYTKNTKNYGNNLWG